MDQDSAHMVAASKVPMLKLVMEGVENVMPITSAEDKAQRRLEVKARSTLLRGILNEHQLKFNSIKDAKLLLEAVEMRFWWRESNALIVNGNETIGFDKSKVECYNCHKRGHFARESRAPRNQDYKENKEVKKECSCGTPTLTFWGISCDGHWWFMTGVFKQRKDLLYTHVPPPYIGNFMPSTPDLSFIGLDKFVNKLIVENRKSDEEVSKVVRKSDDSPIIEDWMSDSKEENVSQPKIEKKTNLVPRAILMKSGLVSVNAARQVNAAHSKTTVNAARLMSYLSKITHSTVKRPIHKNTTFKNSNINQRVNIVRGKNFNTARPKAVVNAGNPQMDLQDQGVIDSECSRHMTWDMSYLTNYEEIDGGYVAFGGNPKGGKIIGKATSDESKLWHGRLGHLNFKTMNKLVKGNLVRGLPSKLFENDQTYADCQKGKQHRASCKSKTKNLIILPLHLFHMDLFGPTFIKSLMKKMYCLVVTDDYSRFTRVFFLATKDKTSGILKSFITGIENLLDHKVKVISVAITPQQNGVAERRNRILIEVARTLLADSKLPTNFWAEAVNTACYVQNKVKAFRVFNSKTRIVEENLHIRFSKNTPNVVGTTTSDNAGQAKKETEPVDEDPRNYSECNNQEKEDNVNSTNNVNAASTNEVNVVGGKTSIELPFDQNMSALEDYSIFHFLREDEDDGAKADMNNLDTKIQVSPIPTTRIHKDHLLDQIKAIQEELLQLKLQEVWTLVDLPNRKRAIDSKWVFRNKKDEMGIVIRNQARLVAQRYTQEEGIDYDEVFGPVARIEAIRLFLGYASFKDFVVYQMDVKSVFLYEKIEEEVYVYQPPVFEDPNFPDRVYKVEKALHKGDILLIQVYVDDIIFGSTKKELCNAFEKLMHEKFQMSSMGELTFFLGLQVQQKKDGIFISQDK
ncbi:putative ribonuclease H-like domain-containing protein [Tanacetum coccineum]